MALPTPCRCSASSRRRSSIDCSKEAAADEKFLLEPSHIEAWEEQHGRIPDGAWVLMRTDWSKREDPARFLNMKEDGPHVPGPSAAAVTFLVQQRNVNGWGVEAVGTDAGLAFTFEPAFPAHHLMHGANKFGLASLCNLDQLPPTGARAGDGAAEDREGLWQPAARAGAGAGVTGRRTLCRANSSIVMAGHKPLKTAS